MENDPAGPLLQLLRRLRRRALVAWVVRHGSAGALYGLTAVGIKVLAAGTGGWPAAALPALFGLVVVLTLLLAAHRLPSLVRVARLVDREERLAERLETALELCREHDAVALLLRSDAVEHLRRLDPRQLVPLRLGGSPRAAGLALALFALFALVAERLPVGDRHLRARLGGSTATAARARADSAAADRSVANVGPAERFRLGIERRPSEAAQEPSSPAGQEPSPASEAGSQRGASGTSTFAPAEAGGAPTAGARTERGSMVEAAAESVEAAWPDSRSGPPSFADSAVEESGRRGGAGAVEGDSFGSEETAGGQGAAAAGNSADGLVARGTERPERGGQPPAEVSPAGQADWSEIERALAAQELPPGLERYVTAYLLAIRGE